MHLVVSRGGVVAFVAEESGAAGNADEVTCNDQSKFGQVALIPRIGLCLKYSVERSANKADTSNLNLSFVHWTSHRRVGIGITNTSRV
jgi:hypothetical protein